MPRCLHRCCLTTLTLLCTLASVSIVGGQEYKGNWPQWRGPLRDGQAASRGLLAEWPKDGPTRLWQVDTVGVGYSSLAVVDGTIYTQGDIDGVEHVIALDATTGKVSWQVQPEPVAQLLTTRISSEFEQHDKDADGLLSETEALAAFGWQFNQYDKKADVAANQAERLASERTARIMPIVDQDKDGLLTFAEVGTLFRGRGNLLAEIDRTDPDADVEILASNRAAALLEELDKDKNGLIDRDEARRSAVDRLFNQMDKRDPDTNKGDNKLLLEEICAFFIASEKGKDGVISAEELTAYYVARHPLADGILTADELRGFFGGYRNGMGDGPRGTPTVDNNRVYVEGGNGDLTCLDAETGKTIWHTNLSRDLGGNRPGWGYSESPLVEGDHLIVTPGGKAGAVAALDKTTGDVVWQSSSFTDGAHYASAVAAEIGGIRQIVQFTRSAMFGLDVKNGKVLWKYSGANNGTANCATPIVYDDRVFASSSYGTGGGLARITTDADTGIQSASEVYFDKKMANHHGGIIMVGEHMYGFGSGGLICMHYLTGEIAWRARSVGKGSLIAADGRLYLLGEGHQLALAELTPEAYREHGRFSLPSHGRPSWAHLAISDGVLFVRDQTSLTAFDIRQK